MSEFVYVGSELDLFASVTNWKSYWASQVRPYLKGDVLEVGAGIGSNTRFLDAGSAKRWVCLEPDAQLAERLREKLTEIGIRRYELVCGTIESVAGQQFDSIVYIDVLEHIERDHEELNKAARLLRPGGRIIVLSPAHQRLFTPFDASIGHFRRYDREMVRAISPPMLRLLSVRYMDSVGLLASAANLLLLRQSMPTKAQLQFWDRWLVPVSQICDRLFLYRVGKSILSVWQDPR